MTEVQIRIVLAAGSFSIGALAGYLFARNTSDKKLTQLQILSTVMFFGYLFATASTKVQYSDLVAITILAITGGEPIGKAIAKKLGKSDEK